MNTILDIMIKSTVLLTFSGLLLFSFRKYSATVRHWLLSLTMIGLLFLPLVNTVLPNWQWSAVSYSIPILEETRPVNQPITQPEIILTPVLGNSTITETSSLSTSITTTSPTISTNNSNITQLLLSIWCIGFLFFQTRMWFGVWLIHSITKRGKRLNNLPKSIVLPPNTMVSINSLIRTPMTWGVFKSHILLPKDAQSWSIDKLELVLLHEIAHIQRKDYWLHLITLLASSIYWFQPLMWLAKKQQLLEREKACDEYVLSQGVSPTSYAEQLVAMAKTLTKPTRLATNHGLLMAKPSQIKQRVLAILHFENTAFKTYKKWSWSILFLGLLFSISSINLSAKNTILPISISDDGKIEINFSSKKAEVAVIETAMENHSKTKAIQKGIENVEILNTTVLQSNSLIQPIPSKPLPAFIPTTTDKLPKVSITEKQSATEKNYFGTFTIERVTYKVWTYGDFEMIDTYPYFIELGDDAVIIIEEIKKGKSSRLILNMIPAESMFLFNKEKRVQIATKLKHPMLVYTWEKKKKKQFYGLNQSQNPIIPNINTSLEKWMKEILPKVSLRILKGDGQKDIKKHQTAWWTPIENHKIYIEKVVKDLEPIKERINAAGINLPFKGTPREEIIKKLLPYLIEDIQHHVAKIRHNPLTSAQQGLFNKQIPTIANNFLDHNSFTEYETHYELANFKNKNLVKLLIGLEKVWEELKLPQEEKGKKVYQKALEAALKDFRNQKIYINQ